MSLVRWVSGLLVVAVVLASAGGQSVGAQASRGEVAVKSSSFVGAWAANISKSKLDPKLPYQSASLDITVDGNTITLTSAVVSAPGAEQRGTETLRTDGVETKGTLTAGVVHFASWVGPKVLAMTAEKDGQLLAVVTYELSGDGKTLTARTSGMLEQTVVFERR